MLSILLWAGLCLAPPSEPPAHGEAAKASQPEMRKPQFRFQRRSPAVPEEHAKEPAEEKTEKSETRVERPRPVLRRVIPKPRPAAAVRPAASAAPTTGEERLRQSLLLDNARLQAEVARAQARTLLDSPIETPEAALGELTAGNQRFVEGKRVRSLLTDQEPALRETLAKGQAPFAVIVACSDSRLADSLIFDQGLGRLFTVREAGNSPDIQGIASAEYGVEHLGAKVVVVVGHSGCGAVKAVHEAHGKPLPGNLWALQAAMAGLEEDVREDPNETQTEYLHRLERGNAVRQAQAVLDRSEILRRLAAAGKVKVVPAYYTLETGRVQFLELPPPAQAGPRE